MREALPGLTLKAWLLYARRATACKTNARGILVVRREGLPYLLGAVCYELSRDVRFGPILHAEHFVAIDLLHSQRVLETLVTALDAVAGQFGCLAIRAVVHNDCSELTHNFQTRGHALDGVVLARVLPTAGARAAMAERQLGA